VTHKDDLLKPRLPEADVETVAGIVRVRALSRVEVLEVHKLGGNIDAIDQRLLELGLVDPPLTSDEVREWRKAWPAGDLEPLTDKIAELSGMNVEEIDRERMFRQLPGESVRVSPSA
jgi:hypothetical protein